MYPVQVSLTLTRDELIAFLTLVGIPTMSGLEEEPLAGLEEQEIAERLNSGEQSLVTRGLLDFTKPEEVVLDDTLVALVGSAATPEATFLLSRVNPDGSSDPHYFHATPELLVEHHSPRLGIHQFDYIPDMVALTERVQALLESLPIAASEAKSVDIQIPSAALNTFVERAQEKELDAARAALVKIGMADSAVDALLADYTVYPSWIGIAGWDLRGEEPQGGETVMVISGAERCWLLEAASEQHGHNMVRLRQASRDQCIHAITSLTRALKRSFRPSQPEPAMW